MLNTNADTMASEVAKALAAVGYDVRLVFCFEFAGVLADPDDETSVIPVIDRATFECLRADGTVSGGMLPKLENCLAAIDAGVSEVVITRADLIGRSGGDRCGRHGQGLQRLHGTRGRHPGQPERQV